MACQRVVRKILVHEVMDNLGVVYPQYSLQLDLKISFAKYLSMITEAYCHLKKKGKANVWVLEVLSITSIDI